MSIPSAMPGFSLRSFTSVLLGGTFVATIISGVCLFLAPSGRVARSTGWEIWGLDRPDWSALHIGTCAVCLVVAGFHLFYNWRIMVNYFRDRMTRKYSFRYEWVVALLLSGMVCWASLTVQPPFSWLLSASSKPCLSGAGAGGGCGREAGAGSGGCGQAQAGCGVEPSEQGGCASCKEKQEGAISNQPMPDNAPTASRGGGPGYGRMTLAEYCKVQNLDLNAAHQRLRAESLKFADSQSLWDIANANKLGHPREVMDIIGGGGRH